MHNMLMHTSNFLIATQVCLVEEPDSRPPYAQPWKLGLVLHQTTSIAQTSNTNSACTSGTSDSSKNIEEAAATDRTGTPRLLPQLKADFVRAHGEITVCGHMCTKEKLSAVGCNDFFMCSFSLSQHSSPQSSSPTYAHRARGRFAAVA